MRMRSTLIYANLFMIMIARCQSFMIPSNMGRNDMIHHSSSTGLLEPSTTVDIETESTELPPVLQQLIDERQRFEMNLGKAMDTLRKDYPYMLKRPLGT